MKIKLESYLDFFENVDNKKLPHFYYKSNDEYKLFAIDGSVSYFYDLEVDDVAQYELERIQDSNKKLGSFYQREPFSSKQLRDGSSLFRRKHGQKITIPANESSEVIFTVPYGKAKINKLEVIDANALDRIDLLVKSPIDAQVAAAYGMPPNYMLNQFGFDVIVSELLYSDKSDYDADVYLGFQIIAVYKNDTNAPKEVGFNLIYHEVV